MGLNAHVFRNMNVKTQLSKLTEVTWGYYSLMLYRYVIYHFRGK
jgi:hypothetical protein